MPYREYLSEARTFWGRRRADLDLSAALPGVVRYPRLDTVTRKTQIITASQPVMELDMYTASAKVCPGLNGARDRSLVPMHTPRRP